MKPFVPDRSIATAWCLEDGCDDYADSVLGALRGTEAMASAVWPLEIANVVRVAERSKRLTKADSARFAALVRGLPVVVESLAGSETLDRVLTTGGEFGLSSYDASYLELAMRQDLALVMRDKALANARERGGVRLFDPGSSR